jgi:predicted DNA-binding transcriptional regulator AlpA
MLDGLEPRKSALHKPAQVGLQDIGSCLTTRPRSRQHEFCPAPFRRGLSRAEAAEYIGLGTTKFDALVSDGRMPKPKRIDGRTVWDRIAVDRAFDELDAPDQPDANPWD